MFCKYCGSKIADDSIFCVHCGKNITEDIQTSPNVTEDDKTPIRIQIVDADNSQWKSTDNLQWVKPLGARITQDILLVVGLFSICYGIVWSCIIEEKVSESSHPCSYPYFSRFEANAYEPIGIIDVFVDLERDDPNFQAYKEEWDALYNEKYDDKFEDKIVKRLCKEWGIDTTLTYSDILLGDHLTRDQRFQIHREIERKTPAAAYIPYDYAKYYTKVNQMAVSKFRTLALFVYILPAVLFVVLSIIWIIKITPKSNNKAILPRDLADKIENYTWNGFTLHKYIRFIKNNKYGIIDIVTRNIIVPAKYELIEWRQTNKSYDGVIDGARSTYYLNK